jgi:hypothetical protein
MEPEGSLPCSREPYTLPYPELDQSSPYHPILSLLGSILRNIILHLCLGRWSYTPLKYMYMYMYEHTNPRVKALYHQRPQRPETRSSGKN